MSARSVWGRLGALLRQKGADPKVAAMFYRAVIQAVLLFGAENWVFSVVMDRKVDGTHTGFLRKITGKQAQLLPDGTWETPRAEAVREAAGMQLVMTYIGRRQSTVAQWVALWPIFELCTGKKGYNGGDPRRYV